MPEKVNHELKLLVKSLLSRDAKKRPTFEEISQTNAFLQTAATEVSQIGFLKTGGPVNELSRRASVIPMAVADAKESVKLQKKIDQLDQKIIEKEQELKSVKEQMVRLGEEKGMQVTLKSFTNVQQLHQGSFSRVFLARRNCDDAEFAVKEIDLTGLQKKCGNEVIAKKIKEGAINDVSSNNRVPMWFPSYIYLPI